MVVLLVGEGAVEGKKCENPWQDALEGEHRICRRRRTLKDEMAHREVVTAVTRYHSPLAERIARERA